MMTKKTPDELRVNKLINKAKREIAGFTELLYRFERSISVLGRSPNTLSNYSRHIVAISLYFGKIPLELDPEYVHDYLLLNEIYVHAAKKDSCVLSVFLIIVVRPCIIWAGPKQ